MAQNFLGALRAQSEGQGNLSMHPQGDNLYGYGPTTHFLAYFRLVLGATNTPPAPRFRPVLGLAAPAAPFGSFGTFRDLGSPEPQNLPRQVLGILADRPPRRPTFRPRGTLGGWATQKASISSFLSCPMHGATVAGLILIACSSVVESADMRLLGQGRGGGNAAR